MWLLVQSLLFKGENMVMPQQTVAPAVWEIYAILPAMIIFMVLAMAMKIVSGLMKPEYVRELRPIAEEVAVAKAGGKYLPPGE
jgi:hypothetical protein